MAPYYWDLNQTEKEKDWTTVVDPEFFKKQLYQVSSGVEIYIIYEAGFAGFGLHRELTRG